MSDVLLFVYGGLRPEYEPPRTMTMSHTQNMYGGLYLLPNGDAAATELGDEDAGEFYGDLLLIDSAELPELDKEELGAGFVRTQVLTPQGDLVYAYEYGRPLPEKAKRIIEGEYVRGN